MKRQDSLIYPWRASIIERSRKAQRNFRYAMTFGAVCVVMIIVYAAAYAAVSSI